MMDLKRIYQSIKQYAETVGGVKKDAALIEVCDFGDSYGFLLDMGDKFANLYWCVEKETYKPFPFRPNMNVDKFLKRKILPKENVR